MAWHLRVGTAHELEDVESWHDVACTMAWLDGLNATGVLGLASVGLGT